MSMLTSKQYQRDRIYSQIYGDVYKSNKMEIIKQSFEIGASKIKFKSRTLAQTGGAAESDHRPFIRLPNDYEDEDEGLVPDSGPGEGVTLKFRIRDTFRDYRTNNLLFGKVLTPYAKDVIMEVIKFYQSQNIEGNTDVKQNIIKFLNHVMKDKDINYDKLMQRFHAESNECLLAYMLIAFQNEDLDLMLRTMYTFGRVLPLKTITEWFDNYRLNTYGNCLNLVEYKRFDCKFVYAVDYDSEDVNEDIEINYDRVVKFLVGSLRAFIIDRELYPEKYAKISRMETKRPVGNERTERKNVPVDMPKGGVKGMPMSDTLVDGMGDMDEVRVRGETSAQMKASTSSSTSAHTRAQMKVSTSAQMNARMKTSTSAQMQASTSTSASTSSPPSAPTSAQMQASPTSPAPFPASASSNVSLQGGAQSDDLLDGLLNGVVDGNLNEQPFTTLSTSKTPKEICDLCYKRYPFFYGGSHGCDVFDMPTLSLSLEEIKQFLDRYPSARVGYILNTATYASGNGEHWVALELTKGKARLVCSQQSDFNTFKDGGRLRNELHRLGFGEEWNTREIQKDEHSCGMFSAMSLMKLLQYRGDINKAVDSIGVDMTKLGKPVGKASNTIMVIESLAGAQDSMPVTT